MEKYPIFLQDISMNLAHHLETLPENASKLSLKVGAKRTKLSHVHSFQYIPAEDEILDTLESYGYGIDYRYARLVWNDEKGRQVKTFSFSTELDEDEDNSTVKVLVNGLLEMAAEQRRFLSTLNATLQQRENTLTNVLETLMESREEVMEERTNALALDLALQDAEKETNLDYKGRALETLSQLGEVFIASKTGAITPDMLKQAMATNPDIVDDMLNDEEFVQVVSQKIVEKSLSNND